jgi:hypothetical protein
MMSHRQPLSHAALSVLAVAAIAPAVPADVIEFERAADEWMAAVPWGQGHVINS